MDGFFIIADSTFEVDDLSQSQILDEADHSRGFVFDVDDLSQAQILDETSMTQSYVFAMDDLIQIQLLNVTYFPVATNRRILQRTLFINQVTSINLDY